MIITIDGPTASGKTSIARMLAQHLDFYYISSGMLFRGLAYILVHEFRYNAESLMHARQEDVQRAVDPERLIYLYTKPNGEQLFFDGVNISNQLRDKKITEYASLLGAQEIVRDALVHLQHCLATHHNIIAEGRDTGSIIFPQAAVKFYLTASLMVRAQRWYSDQKAKGRELSLETAHAEVQKRDERDMNRAIAPLVIPQKAVIVDDSNLSKEQVITLMLEHIKSANQNR
jgi:cytidylate kinase